MIRTNATNSSISFETLRKWEAARRPTVPFRPDLPELSTVTHVYVPSPFPVVCAEPMEIGDADHLDLNLGAGDTVCIGAPCSEGTNSIGLSIEQVGGKVKIYPLFPRFDRQEGLWLTLEEVSSPLVAGLTDRSRYRSPLPCYANQVQVDAGGISSYLPYMPGYRVLLPDPDPSIWETTGCMVRIVSTRMDPPSRESAGSLVEIVPQSSTDHRGQTRIGKIRIVFNFTQVDRLLSVEEEAGVPGRARIRSTGPGPIRIWVFLRGDPLDIFSSFSVLTPEMAGIVLDASSASGTIGHPGWVIRSDEKIVNRRIRDLYAYQPPALRCLPPLVRFPGDRLRVRVTVEAELPRVFQLDACFPEELKNSTVKQGETPGSVLLFLKRSPVGSMRSSTIFLHDKQSGQWCRLPVVYGD